MARRPSFARRVAPAVVLGSAAVAVVALFDPVFGSNSSSLVAAPVTGDTNGTSGGSTNAGASGASSNTGVSGSGTNAKTTSGSGSSGKKGGSSSNSGSGGNSNSGSSGTTDCSGGSTIDSTTVNSRYGPIQIEATVVNGAICRVTDLQVPQGDGRTDYISQQVFPWLDAQAVKNGVNFQSISGATFTSEGYRTALQSILDQM